MIHEYATYLAEQMGISLSQVSIVDGKLLGCRDSHLLKLHSDDHMECALVYQMELDALQNGIRHERLEAKICKALMRLKTMMES